MTSHLSKNRRYLLIQLERLLGSECYNGNVQNWGPGGVFEGKGRDFRYPITFRNEKGEKVKTRTIDANIPSETLEGGYYAFGANELHVVRGLEQILQYLEKHYGLDTEITKRLA